MDNVLTFGDYSILENDFKLVKQRGLEVLEPFIDNIENEYTRNFTSICLDNAPQHFWVVPAGLGKRYHQSWTKTMPLGKVKHTGVAAYCFEGVAETFELDSDELDWGRSAILLHDSCPCGLKEYDTTYSQYHPYFPRRRYQKYAKHLHSDYHSEEHEFDIIMKCIERHAGSLKTGCWNILKLKPQNDLEKAVHIADMVSGMAYLDYAPLMGDLTYDIFNL